MKNHMLLQLLRWLPQNGYSRTLGRIADLPLPLAVRAPAYRLFARRYGVDIEEAELPLEEYPTLGAFFTRRLKPGLRPLDPRPGVIVSPADGLVAANGRAEAGTLLQVKGKPYSVDGLLRDPEAAAWFRDGVFSTVYLSPKDYHRVHFPVGGKVLGFRYLPGKLYPVNSLGVHHVDDLFVTNERLVTYIQTEAHGMVAVVMVGALAVGRISVSYDPVETNRPGPRQAQRVMFPDPPVREAGAELGVFHLGSTVVLLASKPDLVSTLPEGSEVRMGQAILR